MNKFVGLLALRTYENLTLEENARIIKDKIGSMMDTQYSPETKSIKKLERFLEAVELFGKRKSRKQLIDQSIQAKNTFEQSDLNSKNFSKWKSNPNRYDIIGVDSKFGY